MRNPLKVEIPVSVRVFPEHETAVRAQLEKELPGIISRSKGEGWIELPPSVAERLSLIRRRLDNDFYAKVDRDDVQFLLDALDEKVLRG